MVDNKDAGKIQREVGAKIISKCRVLKLKVTILIKFKAIMGKIQISKMYKTFMRVYRISVIVNKP